MSPITPPWFTEGYPHIWLPYTQMQNCLEPQTVENARGSTIYLSDGRELVDGIASWWSVCHGYQNSCIVKSIQKQAEKLSHIMFGGLAHEQAYILAKRLCAIAPSGLERVFFSDSGSTAVEVAMKMAVQFWANKGEKNRNKFICFIDGYHGDTMGAMSLTDPIGGMHKSYNNYMPQQYALPLPRDEYGFEEFKQILEGLAPTAAALIIEPLLQAAGGMKFHSPDILAEIFRIAKEYNLLFIADEIATGFYRTGMRFACDEAGIAPDIMCVGKALTGGHVGMGATLASEEIFNAFLSDSQKQALMHGPTYMANPLACAAANASLDIFEAQPYRLPHEGPVILLRSGSPANETIDQRITSIESQLQEELKICRGLRNVTNVRVMGATGVVEIDGLNYEGRQELRRKFIEKGCWIRPLENVIYLAPSFTITPQELSTLTNAIIEVLSS